MSRRIQLVFQDARASLNPGRTALQLVQEPLQYLRIGGSRQEREMLAMFYLHEVGIAGDAQNRRPPQLSTGQCQRVAIARALVLKPDILICDESVSALDMSIQAQMLTLLRRLHQQHGFAIIMISHDIRVLRSFSHTIAVMHNGTFCEVGETEALLRESKQAYTQMLLHCADDLEVGLSGTADRERVNAL
jgi:peptide/nickel transport system ATP-binding protein